MMFGRVMCNQTAPIFSFVFSFGTAEFQDEYLGINNLEYVGPHGKV